jgi:hypothetical protein
MVDASGALIRADPRTRQTQIRKAVHFVDYAMQLTRFSHSPSAGHCRRSRWYRSHGSGRFPLKIALAQRSCGQTRTVSSFRTVTRAYYDGADSILVPSGTQRPTRQPRGRREFQEVSPGNPIYLFRLSPSLTTYARHIASSLTLLALRPSLRWARLQSSNASSPEHARHLELIRCLPSLQHQKTGLALGLRSYPRPPHGVAGNPTLDAPVRWERPVGSFQSLRLGLVRVQTPPYGWTITTTEIDWAASRPLENRRHRSPHASPPLPPDKQFSRIRRSHAFRPSRGASEERELHWSGYQAVKTA